MLPFDRVASLSASSTTASQSINISCRQSLFLPSTSRLATNLCQTNILRGSIMSERYVPSASDQSPNMKPSPNHALQRTGASVTPAASAAAFPPATQRSRQPRPSLSLGSLGVATRFVFNETLLPDLSHFMASSFFPVLAPRSGSRCSARHHLWQFAVVS